jgi:F0F1-type ATP synthase assembly protein I
LKRESFGFLYYLTLITELGLVMASCILVGLGIGLFIDQKMDSAPWGLLVFLLFGILGAFFSAYRMIMNKIK